MVSSAPCGRQQSACGRSMGQPRGGDNLTRFGQYASDGGTGILYFAKGLHRAAVDRGAGVFDHRAYRPLLLEGKTACVVGAGGIGLDVGKL